MKKLIAATLPIGLALASSQALGRTHINTGTVCQPIAGSTCITYSQHGVGNNCSSEQTVECPLVHSFGGAPTTTQVYYVGYDRHSTANISCALQRTDSDGNVLFTSTKNTSGEAIASKMVVWLNLNQPQGFWWRLRCAIPAVEAGEFSHLTSIVMLTNE
jgi:hypothetical protein